MDEDCRRRIQVAASELGSGCKKATDRATNGATLFLPHVPVGTKRIKKRLRSIEREASRHISGTVPRHQISKISSFGQGIGER